MYFRFCLLSETAGTHSARGARKSGRAGGTREVRVDVEVGDQFHAGEYSTRDNRREKDAFGTQASIWHRSRCLRTGEVPSYLGPESLLACLLDLRDVIRPLVGQDEAGTQHVVI